MQVALTYGRAELDAGKEACVQRNFKEAMKRFECARYAFEKVKDAYENHQDALQGLTTAADLGQLAHYAVQAQADLAQGRREAALGALNLAREYLAESEKKGREYLTVAASLNSLHKQVESEIESIRATTADLGWAEKQRAIIAAGKLTAHQRRVLGYNIRLREGDYKRALRRQGVPLKP